MSGANVTLGGGSATEGSEMPPLLIPALGAGTLIVLAVAAGATYGDGIGAIWDPEEGSYVDLGSGVPVGNGEVVDPETGAVVDPEPEPEPDPF